MPRITEPASPRDGASFRYPSDRALGRNWYGIDEPERRPALANRAGHLDIDSDAAGRLRPHGHRLGMGAGYYDRACSGGSPAPALATTALSSARLRAARRSARSRPAPWDVPLDLVVTERGVLHRNADPTDARSERHEVLADQDRTRRPSASTTSRAPETHHRLGRRAQLPGAQHAARRDAEGRLGFLYHSSCDDAGHRRHRPGGARGLSGPAAFDPKNDLLRSRTAIRTKPRWYSVDVRLERRIDPAITLEDLRKHAQRSSRTW